MNYFRCTVGGSGKGNTVTVTCAEQFAGLTITLSKTGKTYTKTCPSTAPYEVTFYGVEVGTYTVSCTVDGQTYSETVVVQDISCVLNYGFSWKLWVDTASQLDSSDYDSLDEVLADEKALRELFLEHACVDYMASVSASNEDLETVINNDLCAKWINLSDYALDYLYANEVIADLMDEADKYFYGEWALMPQVTTMTSNTTPFGVAFASSSESSYDAWKAFDNVLNTQADCWASSGNAYTNSYIGYTFLEPICLKKVKLITRAGSEGSVNAPKDVVFQGSNDGSNWTDIKEYTNDVNTPYQTIDIDCSNNTISYLRIRMLIKTKNGTGSYVAVNGLQFYAWTPKGNVPVMTSNTAPYGTASANSVSATGREAYRVFDNAGATGWLPSAVSTSVSYGDYVAYAFTNPTCIRKIYMLVNASHVNVPTRNYKLQGSNDGSTWVDIEGASGSFTLSQETKAIEKEFANNEYYLRYRVVYDSLYVSGQFSLLVFTLQFYGRELKVSVPTMTSATAPYGTVFADSSVTGNVYQSFDGNDSTWCPMVGVPSYTGYEFTTPMIAKKAWFSIAAAQTNRPSRTFKIQGYDDSTSEWIDLASYTVSGTSGYKELIDLANTNEYKKYRMYCADGVYISSLSSGYYFKQLQFYGFDYSEKEFEEGATKKWLYDHGVELVDFETMKGSSTTSANPTNDGSQINVPSLVGTNNNTNNFCGIGISVNLSDYALARFICGDSAASPSGSVYSGALSVWTGKQSGSYSDAARQAVTNVTIPIVSPKTLSLDVSSFNDTKFLEIGVSYGNGKQISFTEWWLE